MPFEPVVLFFALGVTAGLLRSDLRLPAALYDTLSLYLLIAIGLKGGLELAKQPLAAVVGPALVVLAAALAIPLVAYPVLTRLGRLSRYDAGSIAAHYGSVSVVTFAVGTSYLTRIGAPADPVLTVYLVLLEIPALIIGVLLARRGEPGRGGWGALLREVLVGKSLFLLVGGLVIGYVAGADGIKPLDRLFIDLFKGVLAFFLLEMGLVVAARVADLRRAGAFIVGFGIAMPIAAACLGCAVGRLLAFDVGSTALLATLYASASYIAAPAAMRIALPEANPALSIGAALGVTFPFNVVAGIPLYHWLAATTHAIR